MPHLQRSETAENPRLAKAPHIYAAGFPCQPWSSAGKGEGESDSQGRGDLFPNILAFIQDAQPDVFILENVKALVSSTHREVFKSMIQSLKGRAWAHRQYKLVLGHTLESKIDAVNKDSLAAS